LVVHTARELYKEDFSKMQEGSRFLPQEPADGELGRGVGFRMGSKLNLK
jgi:hypothetical protein